jgi:hypothetical protein
MSFFSRSKNPKNKFGAVKTICSAGHPHPSGLESSVCEIHILREKAGDIRNLKWQATVLLAFGIKWKVDWSYELAPNWILAFSEAKGAEDRGYKLKIRMWKEGCGKGPLEIWKGTARRPMLVQTVHPKEPV